MCVPRIIMHPLANGLRDDWIQLRPQFDVSEMGQVLRLVLLLRKSPALALEHAIRPLIKTELNLHIEIPVRTLSERD